jgi:hypothetical protein
MKTTKILKLFGCIITTIAHASSVESVSRFYHVGLFVYAHFSLWFDSGNACYHSVQNLSSSRLLSKNIKIRIYKAVVLSVVLCGCETWSLTLREEHTLRMLENRVLRKIFGQKRDEVTGGWSKLHNEELHNLCLYSSPSVIRMIKWRRMRRGRAYSTNTYDIGGKARGKETTGKTKTLVGRKY